MANHSGREALGAYESESVVPFAPTAKNARSTDASQLNSAGQAIMRLLHKAAGVAEANSQQALDMAAKLSNQLRGAEDRIAELEADAQSYPERAERAEQWLHKIYTDVEERFYQTAGGETPQRPRIHWTSGVNPNLFSNAVVRAASGRCRGSAISNGDWIDQRRILGRRLRAVHALR